MKETTYKRLLEQSLGIPFTSGNKVEILKNGIEIFPSMLEAIRNAKERVEFLTYVYWRGDIAEEFAAALSKKAQEGVEVYVRSEEHTSELKSRGHLVCRLLL